MSFLLTLQGMIATALVVGLFVGFSFAKRWKTFGWGIPLAAAIFAAVRMTSVTDILFAALWAALGGFPGAALGSWTRRRFRHPE